MSETLIKLLIVIVCIVLSFGITSVLVWGICKCFALAFSWKIACGVWLALWLVRGVIVQD